MKKSLRLAAFLGIALALGLALIGGVGSHFVLHPPWSPGLSPDGTLAVVDNPTWHDVDTDPLEAFGIAFESVEFEAEDGQTLRGWFVPAGADPDADPRSVILLVHGGGGDRRDYLRHVPIYHGAGWPVLLFDCREQGASDGEGLGLSFGVREHRDVSSAVAWLRSERGFERVGVVGTSVGGASVILAAARDDDIDAVVAENPFATLPDLLDDAGADLPWPIRRVVAAVSAWRTYGGTGVPQPIDVVGRIAPRPLLILHGTGDRMIDATQSERLFAAAGEPKSLWLAPDSEHTQVFDDHPAEYTRRVLAFFEPMRGRTGSKSEAVE